MRCLCLASVDLVTPSEISPENCASESRRDSVSLKI
ncbi:hypothetical protein ANCCAN_03653 [Ancylostoma caninum]|uniref:Uncharacterized protein n=1 Tax=Ancylostoma caninum TaxID=29170 RepID=A0A368H0W1_ANCCA|nr:hypothetical protein ANCCAN_03653 [Ancylostoma caninum]